MRKRFHIFLILYSEIRIFLRFIVKSSEYIYFSGIVGYFSKTRRDIFHGENRPGTGPEHIFFIVFRGFCYKERDIFRKYPFWTHICVKNIRFAPILREKYRLVGWKISVFSKIISKRRPPEMHIPHHLLVRHQAVAGATAWCRIFYFSCITKKANAKQVISANVVPLTAPHENNCRSDMCRKVKSKTNR